MGILIAQWAWMGHSGGEWKGVERIWKGVERIWKSRWRQVTGAVSRQSQSQSQSQPQPVATRRTAWPLQHVTDRHVPSLA